MNTLTQQTYNVSEVDNFATPENQPDVAIFCYEDWIQQVVNVSQRPDNYMKQIDKLEEIRRIFEVKDPIKLLAYWYFQKQISVHHMAQNFLSGIYKEKALYVFLSKQLGWNVRLHTNITEDGKQILGVIASIRERVDKQGTFI